MLNALGGGSGAGALKRLLAGIHPVIARPWASALPVCRRPPSRAGHRAIILGGVEVGLRAVRCGLPGAVHARGWRTRRAVAELVTLVGVGRSADVGPCRSLHTGRVRGGLPPGGPSGAALCDCIGMS